MCVIRRTIHVFLVPGIIFHFVLRSHIFVMCLSQSFISTLEEISSLCNVIVSYIPIKTSEEVVFLPSYLAFGSPSGFEESVGGLFIADLVCSSNLGFWALVAAP